ncbi:MAG: ABC transporter substrate-binding protein [Treponema sp.]|nr:ABC transporter substrate-binding protein [Treponema sp.]
MRKFLLSIVLLLIFILIPGLLFPGGRSNRDPVSRPASGEIGPHGIMYAIDQTLRRIYSVEVSKLSPFNNADSANDLDFNTLGTKTLLSRDRYGQITPGLAHSWEISNDGLVYTFFIREGLVYVDNTKRPVPGSELTADCFVAVMEWVLNPEHLSPNAHQWNSHILNAEEYFIGHASLEDVGFKAIDRYTLQITLKQPVPFFLSIANYMPVYRPFLERFGINYGTSIDSIIFIGPFVLTEFRPQYRRVYEKNPYYFRADEVFIERIVDTFNAEAPLLAPELFLRGEIDYAQISSDIIDMWMSDPSLRNIVNPGLPNHNFQWYYMFNFWPQFDARHEPDNWDIAVNNEAFRKSLFWGLNRYNAFLTLDPFNPELFLQSTITPVGYAVVEGVDYVDLPPLSPFAHHPTFLYDPEKALSYRDRAINELKEQGLNFPIRMLMMYNPATSGWAMEVQVVARQLIDLFGEDYILPIIEAGPPANFLVDVRREGRYAFMKGNNSAVAPGDPASWVWAFQPGMPWNFMDLATGAETRRIYEEYRDLVTYAETITASSYERFLAFAEAEAHLLRHAMVIPYYTSGGGYHAYRYSIWEGYGVSSTSVRASYEGMRMLAEPLTAEQWQAFYNERRLTP